VLSFSVYLVIQMANLCHETTAFTLPQVAALAAGLGGSVGMYLVLNSIPRAQGLVDYYAFFHTSASPVAILTVPLVTVAAMAPVVACNAWTLKRHTERATTVTASGHYGGYDLT
jgi:hypothetical protein